jgi:hypothetical protein
LYRSQRAHLPNNIYFHKETKHFLLTPANATKIQQNKPANKKIKYKNKIKLNINI